MMQEFDDLVARSKPFAPPPNVYLVHAGLIGYTEEHLILSTKRTFL